MRTCIHSLAWLSILLAALAVQAAPEENDPKTPADEASAEKPVKPKLAKDPPGMTRLLPDADLWIDTKNKRVVLDGTVCLIRGQLEMFACIKGTKEHESIVAVEAQAHAVHAALLAVGAKQGTPVQFRPEYKAATGTIVDITVIWTDAEGKVHRDRAQDWIRDIESDKPMPYSWVFAGSNFWTDEKTGEKRYMAEGGDFICVSNFPSAMLDLPVESSSQAEMGLRYTAFSEHIPPRGTRVRLVLTPRLEKATEK